MIYYNTQENIIGILTNKVLVRVSKGKVFRVLTDKWVFIGQL